MNSYHSKASHWQEEPNLLHLCQLLHSWSASHSKFLSEHVLSEGHAYLFDPHELPGFLPFPLASAWRPFFFLAQFGELRIPHPIHWSWAWKTVSNKLQKCKSAHFVSWWVPVQIFPEDGLNLPVFGFPVTFKHLNSTCPPNTHNF